MLKKKLQGFLSSGEKNPLLYKHSNKPSPLSQVGSQNYVAEHIKYLQTQIK